MTKNNEPAESPQPEEGASGFSPMSIASPSSPQRLPEAAASAGPAPASLGPIKLGLSSSTSTAQPAFSLPSNASSKDGTGESIALYRYLAFE